MRAQSRGPMAALLILSLVAACVVVFWLTDSNGSAGQGSGGNAPVSTVVSMTWDDATASQYELAFRRALEPHEVHATFFINSGNVGNGPGFMSWSDVRTLADAGNDIGGHTIDHVDLTDSGISLAQKVHQVCDDRRALIEHGFGPANFAYPYAALDAVAERVVKRCGYGTARSGGGTSPSGPVHAETIPPGHRYATRAWSPPNGEEITLPDLEAVVGAAAQHGGGWVQIVGHQVCSRLFDPGTYAECSKTYGWIDLATLNRFLDWLQNAGLGGAPAGTVVRSVAEVVGETSQS